MTNVNNNLQSKIHMKSKHKSVSLSIVVLTAVGLILASCSSSSSIKASSKASSLTSALTNIQLASAQLNQAKTAAVTITGSVNMSSSLGSLSNSGSSNGLNLTINGNGNMDIATNYENMSLNMPLSINLPNEPGSSTITEKIVRSGNILYLQMPNMPGSGSLGSGWYSINLSNFSELSNTSALTAEFENPALLIQSLSSVSSLESEDTVTINGQTYNEYKLNVGLEKMLGKYASKMASSVGSCLNSEYNVPVTVLITPQNQLHSISMSMNMSDMFSPNSKLSALMSLFSLNLNMQVVYSNYGETFNEYVPTGAKPLPSSMPGSLSGSSFDSSKLNSMMSSLCS